MNKPVFNSSSAGKTKNEPAHSEDFCQNLCLSGMVVCQMQEVFFKLGDIQSPTDS